MTHVEQVSRSRAARPVRASKPLLSRNLNPFTEAVEAVMALKDNNDDRGFNYISADSDSVVGPYAIAELEGDFGDFKRALTSGVEPVLQKLSALQGALYSNTATADDRSKARVALKSAVDDLTEQLERFAGSVEHGKTKVKYNPEDAVDKVRTGSWSRFTLKFINEHGQLDDVVVAADENHAPFLRSVIKDAKKMAKGIERTFAKLDAPVQYDEPEKSNGRS